MRIGVLEQERDELAAVLQSTQEDLTSRAEALRRTERDVLKHQVAAKVLQTEITSLQAEITSLRNSLTAARDVGSSLIKAFRFLGKRRMTVRTAHDAGISKEAHMRSLIHPSG